jgi:hypothetical protein
LNHARRAVLIFDFGADRDKKDSARWRAGLASLGQLKALAPTLYSEESF